jgi:hypothetical protein
MKGICERLTFHHEHEITRGRVVVLLEGNAPPTSLFRPLIFISSEFPQYPCLHSNDFLFAKLTFHHEHEVARRRVVVLFEGDPYFAVSQLFVQAHCGDVGGLDVKGDRAAAPAPCQLGRTG